MAFLTDYQFELGDWRDGDYKWAAEFYAGNADPRPGVPLKNIEFGVSGGNYHTRISPSIPLGKGLD